MLLDKAQLYTEIYECGLGCCSLFLMPVYCRFATNTRAIVHHTPWILLELILGNCWKMRVIVVSLPSLMTKQNTPAGAIILSLISVKSEIGSIFMGQKQK